MEVQRYYNNLFERIIDFIIEGFYLNVKVCDTEQNTKVSCHHNLTFLKDSWTISAQQEQFQLKCITKIRTNPQYAFTYQNSRYLLYRDFLGSTLRIQNVDTKKVMSEYKYLNLLPLRKVKLTHYDDTIDLSISLGLYLILSTKYP
ncbi:hypothetical protein SABR111722_19215 [Saccharibacillus brassicae]